MQRFLCLNSTWHFLLVLTVCLIIQCWDEGKLLMYPLAMFDTVMHKWGHGLGALLAGYEFTDIEVYSNLKGVFYFYCDVTETAMMEATHSAGGVLIPLLLGACMLFLTRRYHQTVLTLLPVLLLGLATFEWYSSDKFTMFVGFGFFALAAVLMLLPWPSIRQFIIQLLGIQLFISPFVNPNHIFTDQVMFEGDLIASDSQNVASALGLSYEFWAGVFVVLLVSFLILILRYSKPFKLS